MRLTRDSALLKIIPLLALLLNLMVQNMTNPVEFGLSPISVKWIGLIAQMIGTVAAWLATSILPGKRDDRTISGPRSGFIGVGLLLAAAGAVGSIGCGPTRAQPQLPTSLPAIIETADRDVHAAAIKALGILKVSGSAVRTLVQAEADLAPAMTPQMRASFHEPFRAAANKLAVAALAAIDAIESGATVGWPQLKRLLDPIVASAGRLIDLVRAVSPDVTAKSGFRAMVDTLWQIVSALTLPTLRESVPAGAR